MATTKQNIGKIPIMKGEYQEGVTYQRLNQVTMLGSTYQSKIDGNTSAPAQLASDGSVENINTDKWIVIAVGNVSTAKKVMYDNETSKLESENVQGAIDEVTTKVSDLGGSLNDVNDGLKSLNDKVNDSTLSDKYKVIKVDAEHKIIEGITKDNCIEQYLPTEFFDYLKAGNVTRDKIFNDKYVCLIMDSNNKILRYIKPNGVIGFPAGIESPSLDNLKENLEHEISSLDNKVNDSMPSQNNKWVKLDAERKILEAISSGNVAKKYLPTEFFDYLKAGNVTRDKIFNDKYVALIIDKDGKIIRYTKSDGVIGFPAGIESFIPTPYATQYKEEEDKIEAKLKEYSDISTIRFLLHTDNHYWDDSNGNNVEMTLRHATAFAKLSSKFSVDFQVNLGDLVMNKTTSENENMVVLCCSRYQDSQIPFLYTEGNHEAWEGHGEMSKSFLFGATSRFGRYLKKNYNTSDNNKMYYYIDFEIQKIRAFFLDSSSEGTVGAGLSTKQITWVDNSLENLPSGYKVIFMSHIPSYGQARHGSASLALEDRTPMPFTNSEVLQTTLKKHVDNGVVVLACLCGHMHWDCVTYDPDVKCPVICTTSEKFESLETPNKYKLPNTNPTCPVREKGKYSEYAADIFNISSNSDKIHTLRFGAGKSRHINIKTIGVEAETYTLTSELSNTTWGSVVDSVASVDNGIVKKKTAGTTIIYAENDNDIEYWNINFK